MNGHEQAYQNKFNETMDTEARIKALEVKVAELRRQTDLTYQVLGEALFRLQWLVQIANYK